MHAHQSNSFIFKLHMPAASAVRICTPMHIHDTCSTLLQTKATMRQEADGMGWDKDGNTLFTSY